MNSKEIFTARRSRKKVSQTDYKIQSFNQQGYPECLLWVLGLLLGDVPQEGITAEMTFALNL